MPAALPQLAEALRDRYALERELGRGGMAVVYLARDIKHDRPVAVKVLHPELAAALGPERFLSEIRLTARLQHPHILPLFDSGETAGLLYYVMPYVDGESLRQRLQREKQLPVEDALRIAGNVLAALAYAHDHGIIHRDIKPDNILIERGEAVVADFGIAHAVNAAGGERLTGTGVTLGTPAYMSPEQASAARDLDARSDLYSFGCVLYEMLAGEPPFRGPTAQAVIAQRFTAPVPKLRWQRDTVPELVDQAVERSLARLPADRFATAAQFASALALPQPAVSVARAPATARRRLLAWLGLTAVLGLGAAILLSRERAAPADPAADVIAVAPFRVSGADPALGYLREGMVDLLAAKLTGEAGPRAVDPRTALAAWRRSGALRDRDLPQEAMVGIARRLGAGQLLLGEVVGTSTRLVLNVAVVNASKSGNAARASVNGSADSLPALIDRLTAQLLASRAGESQQRLSAVTSTSLEALRAYLDGRAAYRRGEYREGVEQFQRALADDSAFALAGMGLAASAEWLRDAEAARRGLGVAWAHRIRLSARDRAILTGYVGSRYPIPAARRELLAAWERAVKLAPDQPEVWYELGDLLYHFGGVLGEPGAASRATQAFKRAVALDSTYAAPLSHLVDIAARTGDTTALRRLGALWQAADSMSEVADFTRWRIAATVGEAPALAAVRARFDSMEFQSLRRILAAMQLDPVMLGDADRVAAALLRAAASSDDRARAIGMMRELALNRGRPAQALVAGRSWRAADPASRASVRGLISDALYGDGDRAAAQRAVAELSQSADRPPAPAPADRVEQGWDACLVNLWRVGQGEIRTAPQAIALLRSVAALEGPESQSAALCASTLQAMTAAADRGRGGAALAQLDSLLLTGLVTPDGTMLGAWDPSFPGSLGVPGSLVLARILETQGDPRAALAAVRRRPYVSTLVLYISTFLREEGRLAALSGDSAGAIRAYKHYLALRSDPEPSIKPEVERVRAELAALEHEPATQ